MTFILLKNLIQGVIVFQSLFFTFFLIYHKEGKRKSNVILASFTFILGLHFLNLILSDYSSYFIPYINSCFLLLYAPLIFIYCQSYLNQNFNFKSKQLLHLLPISYVVFWHLFLYDSYYDKGYLFNLISIPVYLQIVTYLVVSYKLLEKKSKETENYMPSEYNWLKFIILTFLSTIFLYLVVIFFKLIEAPLLEHILTILFLLIMLVLVNGFVFKGLSQPELFRNEGIENQSELINSSLESNSVKYAYSNLNEDDSDKKLKILLDYMEKQKPYMNSLMTLPLLSKSIPMDARHISQIINEKLDKHFYDFINEYRINEAKKIIEESNNNNIKITELMYQVGFNSKSTFNTAFKKYTGKTPSQLKKECNIKNV